MDKYFEGDELAYDAWRSKYQLGSETLDEFFERLAREFARLDNFIDAGDMPTSKLEQLSAYGLSRVGIDRYKQFLDLFQDFKYIIPGGSVLAGIGSGKPVSLSNCLQGDTKILTRDGYKLIKTLAGKEIEIMTKGGGWTTVPFKSYGIQKLKKITLTKGKTNIKEIFCTEDHNWFKNKEPLLISTKNLKIGDKLHNQFGKSWNGIKASPIGIAHGICFGDGHSVKGENNCNNITLCAESRILSKYYPDCYVSTDETLCEGGSDFYSYLPNYYRELPNIRENKSYLLGWLSGYFTADGCLDTRGSAMLNSTIKENLEFVQDVCGVLGIACGEIQSQDRISNLTNKQSIIYKVFLPTNFLSIDFFLLDKHKKNYKQAVKSPAMWVVESIEDTILEEEVYCAEVPDTYSFVIENNILSGNCFVIPTGDSIGEIFDTAREMAEIYKRRGGVGNDLSSIRPAGAGVNNAAKTTGGVVPFMELFSQATNTIGQDGRRGALMLSLDINHPDSPAFVLIKQDLSKVTGANVSVRLNDEFMKAVENDEDYILRWPCDFNKTFPETFEELEYNKLTEFTYISKEDFTATKVYWKKIRAKELWESIIHCAWNTAEPGILFWDNIINNDPASVYPEFRAISTNPCGEIPLSAYDSCRLIATNLYGIVDDPFTENARINEDIAYKVFYEAQIIGDILVDLEIEAVERIMSITKGRERELWSNVWNIGQKGRRTGVGITALADMLAALNSDFVSPKLVENVMRLKMEAEFDASIDLAIINGPFPAYNINLEWSDYENSELGIPIAENKFFHTLRQNFPMQVERMLKYGRRNVSWSTIAPTGTISIQAGVSSGGETTFSIYYTRRKKCNTGETPDFVDQNGVGFKNYNVVHGTFKKWANIVHGISGEELANLPQAELDILVKESPWNNNTAPDILPFDRVKIQSILQKYTTHSISSTINLPKEATEEAIATIYMEASKQGCKGITVER